MPVMTGVFTAGPTYPGLYHFVDNDIRYQIQQVIYRQGAYEARYDAVLVMGQPGLQSLQALYANMIPEAERTKLPQASLEAYETWLQQQAQTLKKTSAPQAAKRSPAKKPVTLPAWPRPCW